MSDHPEGSKVAIVNWLTTQLHSVTLGNVLTLALLSVVTIPSYGAYRFLTDEKFRHELVGHIRQLDLNLPCLVYSGSVVGQIDRTYILVSYAHEGRFEKVIGMRTQQGILPEAQIVGACERVVRAGAIASEHDRKSIGTP